ncbi:hypothetical protein LIA77_06114 [Sarocladium implicatum]|nr:hypothetical protein LIA77_06114 [Sarocladium implicatum]
MSPGSTSSARLGFLSDSVTIVYFFEQLQGRICDRRARFTTHTGVHVIVTWTLQGRTTRITDQVYDAHQRRLPRWPFRHGLWYLAIHIAFYFLTLIPFSPSSSTKTSNCILPTTIDLPRIFSVSTIIGSDLSRLLSPTDNRECARSFGMYAGISVAGTVPMLLPASAAVLIQACPQNDVPHVGGGGRRRGKDAKVNGVANT